MERQPYIVILAGGLGIRLWPQSRQQKPKQFYDLLGTGRTLLQMTFDRLASIYPPDRFLVVTGKRYQELVKEQLPELKAGQILSEPVRRNTAASIGLASYVIQKLDPNAEVIVVPSDQVIFNETAFFEILQVALEAARSGSRLITIGIRPHSPETEFGYIQYIDASPATAHKVKTFTEKPHLELAQTFVESGDFLWNSGIFVWKNQSLIRAFEQYLPGFAEVFEEGGPFYSTPEEPAFLRKAYSLIKNVPIDSGLLAKSDRLYVVCGDFLISDLGSWRSLYGLKNKDQNGNVAEGAAVFFDSEGCYAKSTPGHLILAQGLKGYLIVEHDNVLLICKLEEEKKFREFINAAKEKGADFG